MQAQEHISSSQNLKIYPLNILRIKDQPSVRHLTLQQRDPEEPLDMADGRQPQQIQRFQPPVTMSEDDILLSSNIVLHENKPICDDTRVFRGTFGNKLLGNKAIALKIAKYGELERKEAEFHHSLPQHPNLVRLIHIDAFDYRGKSSIYIAMELCEMNLYEYIVKQKDQELPFDPIKYLAFAKDIARGLSVLHDLKKIHRDLKPSNILLIENCTIAKISDFGLSKEISGGKTQTAQSRFNAGTDGWKSPEVLRDDTHISTPTDIFSGGIIFAFMWSYGEHPYGSDRHSRNYFILNKPPDLDGILLGNQTLVKQLVSDMLNQNPEQRPTADDVLENEIFAQEDAQLLTEPTRQVRNLTKKKLSLEGEAAKLKKANKFDEATPILEHVRAQQEDRLLNTHLDLVECNVFVKKFEEARKCQKRLVKIVELQDLSPEEVKSKADHCIKSKRYIRAFLLLHTAGKLVKVRTSKIAEFLNKIFKEMDEILCKIIKEDKSKKDIVIDYLLPSMHEFTVSEMAKRGASSNFLKMLEENQDGIAGVYLLTLIEETIFDKNYDEADKIRGKLVQFQKLQRIPIKIITNVGQKCEEKRQYVKAYTLYFLAARLAKLTMSGTEAAEVIYNQEESIAKVADKMMREENKLCDIVTDYIVPSTDEFTVTNLKEEGKVSEALYLQKQHEVQTPKLMIMLVNLAVREAEDKNFASVMRVIDIALHFAKLQQVIPDDLYNVGNEFQSHGEYVKAYLCCLSAVELGILASNGGRISKLTEMVMPIAVGVLNEMVVKDQDVNIIVNVVRASMYKFIRNFKNGMDMTQEQITVAQCWCLLSIGSSYGIQEDFQRAVSELDSMIEVMRSKFGRNSRQYKVVTMALATRAQNNYFLYKNDEAIKVCKDALSAAKDAKDWDDERERSAWLEITTDILRDVRGESSIGASLQKWSAKYHFGISTSSRKIKTIQ